MDINNPRPGERRLHPAWWTTILVVSILAATFATAGFFTGTFTSYVPVTLTADRAGLVMEPGGKVKLRGVEVGLVESIIGGNQPVALRLQIDPDQISHIPANVGAQIRATTAFGAKFVDLVYPEHPISQRLAAGAVLHSSNVTTEVNTVFQNLVDVLHRIDPPKLNAVISALADGVRGEGARMGEATTAANNVLLSVNARSDALGADWRAWDSFNQTYSAAAANIISAIDATSTTSKTITDHSHDLDTLLLNTIGLTRSGTDLLAPPNQQNFIDAINSTEPTTDLLLKYSPSYTCLLVGAKLWYDKIGERAVGGNGRTVVLDSSILWGSDSYTFPDNLPIVAAKGGPGGKPGCGSLPDATKNFPVRALVTNTGWGTGLDYRPNPGIGHPFFAYYFPTTRAVPRAPHYFGLGPVAPGPIPYPGAPPYGAPLYGPGGVPLWPGVPPAPQPPAPEPPTAQAPAPAASEPSPPQPAP